MLLATCTACQIVLTQIFWGGARRSCVLGSVIQGCRVHYFEFHSDVGQVPAFVPVPAQPGREVEGPALVNVEVHHWIEVAGVGGQLQRDRGAEVPGGFRVLGDALHVVVAREPLPLLAARQALQFQFIHKRRVYFSRTNQINNQIKVMMFLNFQRIFGGFGSQIDTIIEKPDCTLESILDENILDELKNNSGGSKFGSFVIKDVATFERVIDYLVTHETELNNQKKQIRYPFMLSEVFATENSTLIDYFFEPDRAIPNWENMEERRVALLPRLFKYLEADFLIPTQAGYFAKVVNSLIRKRGYEVWDFLLHTDNGSIFSNLIKHLDVVHISEIVEKLITLSTNQENAAVENNFLDERKHLLNRVINYLSHKTHQSDIVDNCIAILTEVATRSDCFFDVLFQPKKLFSIGLNSGAASVISFIITLIDQIQNPQKNEDDKPCTFKIDYNQLLTTAVELPRALGSEKIHLSSFNPTYGGEQTAPFSCFKLKLVQLAFTLIKLNDNSILEAFSFENFYRHLLDSIVKYEFNNQLQNLFYDITLYVFSQSNLQVYQETLIKLGFFQFLMHHNTLTKKTVGDLKKEIRAGYCGILSKLSYQLDQRAQAVAPEWSVYQKEVLGKLREVELSYMFGVNPHQKILQDEDETRDILIRISEGRHHKSQDQEETVQVEETEENDRDGGQDEENEEQQKTGKGLQLDEKALEEKITEVILSPKTSPKEVQDIIQFQESLKCKSPQEAETEQDRTVNRYWKAHENLEDPTKRKLSQEEHLKHEHNEQIDQQEEIEEDIQQESTEELQFQAEKGEQHPQEGVKVEKEAAQEKHGEQKEEENVADLEKQVHAEVAEKVAQVEAETGEKGNTKEQSEKAD